MIHSENYTSLERTLQALRVQVGDSLQYAREVIPQDITTPEQLFNWLKSKLTYKKDPKGIELLQSMQTLFEREGFGDCDCFTITGLACMYILNFKPLYVDLAGNNRFSPSHIYASVYDKEKGKICAFDLTNPVYNMQRPYKFKQRLLFRL